MNEKENFITMIFLPFYFCLRGKWINLWICYNFTYSIGVLHPLSNSFKCKSKNALYSSSLTEASEESHLPSLFTISILLHYPRAVVQVIATCRPLDSIVLLSPPFVFLLRTCQVFKPVKGFKPNEFLWIKIALC